jgi:hypothetical protein
MPRVNKEKAKMYAKKYYSTHRREAKSAAWRFRGIEFTPEQYDELIEKQNNRCAICNRHQSEFQRTFDLDHDHNTGKVRGLLCHNCNNGIGHFKDDIEIMEKAIVYIRQKVL